MQTIRLYDFRSLRTDKEAAGLVRHPFFIILFLALALLAAPLPSPAQVSVGVSITVGPPPLPVYAQPLCPGPGFIWLPGYWAWDPAFGYYWVPGMWAPAPFTGALWTPGYWGWNSGVYVWHEGYWGPAVGFYGGINYGFGYTGHGYYGGYWRGGRYYYNRTVNNINVTNITTVYSKPVGNARPTGPSFNGGHGGTSARPTSNQLAAERRRKSALTSDQVQQIHLAREDRRQRASVNHGRPAVAAMPKPGALTDHGLVPAERAGTPYPGRREGQGAPGEQVRTTKHGSETHRPANAPGHPQGVERAPSKQSDVRSGEPHPGKQKQHQQQQQHPQRESGQGERKEPR